MDFITDLPPSKRENSVYDSILVIVDRYSKMCTYVPTTKRITSVDLATVLVQEVVRHRGVPRGIVTDRGSVFTSQYWSDFAHAMRIHHKLSTAFHPQTDGQTERANQTLEQYLRCYCNEEQDDWATKLPLAEYAANAAQNKTLKMSPFQVLYGFQPEILPLNASRDETLGGKVPAAAERAEEVRTQDEKLKHLWRQSVNNRANYHDSKHKRREYAVGDMVMLSTKNLRLKVPKKKLAARYVGPFRIRDVIGTQAYRIALPKEYPVHNVFHVSLLEPWQEREGVDPPAPMPLAEDNDEWIVEAVVDARKVRGAQEYLVRWAGYLEDYNTWEPAENCENAEEKVSEYWSNNAKEKSTTKVKAKAKGKKKPKGKKRR